jgi:hypothetical protein
LGVIPIIKTDNVSWIVAQKIRHYSIQYVQNILWTNIGIINILWPNIGIKNNIIGYLGCVTHSINSIWGERAAQMQKERYRVRWELIRGLIRGLNRGEDHKALPWRL